MRILIPLVSQSMTAEEYMSDAINACEVLAERLKGLFGNNFTVTVIAPNQRSFGKTIEVSIYNVPSDSTHLQRLNAAMSIRLMMHLENDYGKQTDMTAFSFDLLGMSYQVKKAGLKYRKISGKSPMQASVKLLEYFTKNVDIMTSL